MDRLRSFRLFPRLLIVDATVMVEEERRRRKTAELKIWRAAEPVEAEKALSDHERAQKAFRENRERLKAERLARDEILRSAEEMRPGPAPQGSIMDLLAPWH
jgi:hypothetical protein